MIIGSEPVSIDAITTFNKAFAPYGLPRTAFKPSYGIAEATLFVATIDHDAEPTVAYFDREQLGAGHAVRVAADAPNAVAQVSCGQVARSLWAVIVNPETEAELPGRRGRRNLVAGQQRWPRLLGTARRDPARVRRQAEDRGLPRAATRTARIVDGTWLRTGDLGVYLDGELYVTGRIADLVTIDGRNHYPQDIEATAADASPMVRRGYVTAFSVPADTEEARAEQRLVIIAERAAGTSRADPQPAIEAIRRPYRTDTASAVSDVRFLPAGAIPRTTSGKLARLACRAQYLSGTLGAH